MQWDESRQQAGKPPRFGLVWMERVFFRHDNTSASVASLNIMLKCGLLC